MSTTATTTSGVDLAGLPNKVVVHPLVLLSVVDHYNRVAKDTSKRVVGVLLGDVHKGVVDITNSYAVPFEEDAKDPSIWFFDHNYHEDMYDMFRKVQAKEKIVGWYSTGPKIRPADMQIHNLICKYTANPVLVIVNVDPKDDLEIPTDAYCAIENVAEEQQQSRRTFMHLPSDIQALEAEEVGVEHLLRDIRDVSVGTLSDQVQAKLASLKGLKKRMEEMHQYLEHVVSGKVAPNHQIIYNMQDIFNLSPHLNVEELVESLTVTTNDSMLVVYLSSLVRSITALHDLINNKVYNIHAEKREAERRKRKERGAADKTDAGADDEEDVDAETALDIDDDDDEE
jgi:26S proteasome regulatory subunit N8